MFSQLAFGIIFIKIIVLCEELSIINEHNTKCTEVTKDNINNICKNPSCLKSDTIAFFCEHVYEKIFKCHPTQIPLSYICDGIKHCQHDIDEIPEVCSYVACEKNFVKCHNYKQCIHVSKLCNGINDCQDGSDEFLDVCQKLLGKKNIYCPGIFDKLDNTYKVTCYINHGNMSNLVSCEGLLLPGTRAKVQCFSYHVPDYQQLICQSDGTWNQNIMPCFFHEQRNCGVINEVIRMKPLILNGLSVNSANSWPWYSALFQLEEDKWKFFCSATIISNDTVITAAHCVWGLPNHFIKVAAGKVFSDFYTLEPESQIVDVKRIFVHPLYQDSLGNYGSDIAIIKLKQHFKFSDFLLPLCMNWTLRNIIKNTTENLKGKVAGMGITEKGTISNNLRSTYVQLINNKDCMESQKYEFRKYVNVAVFCGEGLQGGVICNGDSGSGLAIKNKNSGRWFLEGIVSISPKNPNSALCDSNFYTIYTNVGMFTNWIQEYIKS